MSSRERNEQKALKLIFDAGDEGFLQSELWKQLGITSREGSRIVKKFEEKGKVKREQILHNGRWTFNLYFTKQPVTFESIERCPCFICFDIDKCFRGGTKDPNTCINITAWIDPRILQQASENV
jgi:hypothetical protein